MQSPHALREVRTAMQVPTGSAKLKHVEEGHVLFYIRSGLHSTGTVLSPVFSVI